MSVADLYIGVLVVYLLTTLTLIGVYVGFDQFITEFYG